MSEEEFIQGLRRSREVVGEIDPVFLAKDGTVIDGFHRLKAYPGWKTVNLDVDRKKALLMRIHRNYVYAKSKEETKRMLIELAEILISEGVPAHQTALKVAEITPYSQQYVYSLLPKKYKEPTKAKTKSTFKRLYPELTKPPQTKEAEAIKEETPLIYTCPICGTKLKLAKNQLIIA